MGSMPETTVVVVKVTHKLTIELEEGADIESVMGEMNCDFQVCEEIDRATVLDTEMEDWHKVDS